MVLERIAQRFDLERETASSHKLPSIRAQYGRTSFCWRHHADALLLGKERRQFDGPSPVHI